MSARYTLEENEDGSAIVKLAQPVKLGNELVSRLTIPAITGKHMRACPWRFGETVSIGGAVDFAASLIEPAGIVDVLPAILARDLGGEVLELMGKFLTTGEPASPSSGG